MELNEKLQYCKICTKRKFSDIGIVCSLTSAKPAFENQCNEFLIDPKEEQKAIAKERYKDYDNDGGEDGGKTSVWTYVFIAFVVIKIIIRLVRD
ncbi:hypothetical protein [Tenacibaculum ovolyticum]|uniref:hypothetical protein n=1 Tax=Tenacibaculum ovolyticum TaxID=104270 RepID=UPI001F40BF7F|nr:hypothetical protein [Tenacibaculum ovolyticum]